MYRVEMETQAEEVSPIQKMTEYLSQFKNEPELSRFPLPDAVFKELKIEKPLNKFEVGKLLSSAFYSNCDKIEHRKTPDDIVFPELPPPDNFLEIKEVNENVIANE